LFARGCQARGSRGATASARSSRPRPAPRTRAHGPSAGASAHTGRASSASSSGTCRRRGARCGTGPPARVVTIDIRHPHGRPLRVPRIRETKRALGVADDPSSRGPVSRGAPRPPSC
jgi:hypothetical protein